MKRKFIDIPIQEIPQATKEEVKFISLLNDYLLKYYAEYWNRNLYCELGGWSLLNVHETVIISKKFWFIQRLIKENKIDFQKFREKAKFLILSNSIESYEILIMELSIQKNPVKFLISILK